MKGEHKPSGILPVVMAAIALMLLSFCAVAAVLSYAEYRTNKARARARSIEVLQQIEAREAQQRTPTLISE
jgi:lipopolysaccharide export LptBFGC system permease protein LptF